MIKSHKRCDFVFCAHAQGGLGEVFVAKDTELNREVALKQIQARHANDESSRLRFLLEAEVTGGLEHPGIVPVYGLGRYQDGRPFYAMRFIKGDTLRQATDRFHRVAGQIPAEGSATPPVESTDRAVDFTGVEFRKLLGRFLDVCQAIEYAHSRGVLHRDLKPGNIMLGKYGETLVVDWGLAKTTEPSPQSLTSSEAPLQPASASGNAPTVMGSAIGTPSFMPPEQAAGHLDELGPTSDVYSLGATLYYLLTGKVPFQGKDIPTLLNDVRSGKFPRPRSIQPHTPKALEAVCLKAMSLHPSNRYASQRHLADDIERYLADEPVSSFTEPVTAQVRRWARKHRTATTATAAVILVSALGLGIFSTIVSAKNSTLKQLNASLDDKNGELVEANQRERDARQLATTNELTAREQSQLALSTLTAVVRDIQLGLLDVPGGSEVRRRLLQTSLQDLQHVSTGFVAKAAVDFNTLEALSSMGDIVLQFGVGHSDPVRVSDLELSDENQSAVKLATTFYARAHEIGLELVADNPDSEMLKKVSHTYNQLGNVNFYAGQLQEALNYYRRGLEINTQLLEADPDVQ